MKNQFALLALTIALALSCVEEEPKSLSATITSDMWQSNQMQTQKDFAFIGGTIPEYDQQLVTGGQINFDID